MIAKVEEIKARGVHATGILVIDTLIAAFGRRFADSSLLNNSVDVSQVTDDLRAIAAATGWAVVLICHSSKASSDAMGSAQWQGGVDLILKAGRPEGEEVGELRGRGRGIEPWSREFSLAPGGLVTCRAVGAARQDEQEAARGAREAEDDALFLDAVLPLGADATANVRALIERGQEAGLSKARVLECLKRAEHRGEAESRSGPRRSTLYWRPAPAPAAAG
ncbi:hypothetical protein ElP_25430 [Tautonia plasticadhaerens]|uniref:Uncharacterized protein n=1 Tax=Tautonia plasticadhaerens TaxID=2527974 RepID=A0A518H1F5_9BACT|nr:hypothetical protein ElP_25430 [Tautonia plasticadhaerens]